VRCFNCTAIPEEILVPEYDADLGTWERGRRVKVVASTPEVALKEARKLLQGNEEVVQICLDNHYVYDYMNGFYRR
jgi:hypothetical protein